MIAHPPTAASPTRCAIYTRKSSEEGLEQDFNSLHAQRASAEAYITSQGWACLPDLYDDGGYTGGNTDRPGLARLMADIEAGKVDCVVVYKVDRLSRSLMDFARLMEVFDRKGVSFVSVTQHFNTTHSMGRLTLNILLSFAQFEREIISERTRDKIAGARQRGKWAGGHPVLGYDLEPRPGGSRLVVNAAEAQRVREIFGLYLSLGCLSRVAAECTRRRWTTKAWRSKAGAAMGGRAFDKSKLHSLLTNPLYLGKIRHHSALFDGEHEAIVDTDLFEKVQARLRLNGRTGGSEVRTKHEALLRGLVRCKACDGPMGHHYATRPREGQTTIRYRYYICTNAQRQGYDACPGPSLPAGDLEAFVMERVKEAVTKDAAVDAVAAKALEVLAATRPDLIVDRDELVGAAEAFEPVWQAMTMSERRAVLAALIESVEWDAPGETVNIHFREAELASVGAGS